MIMTQRTSVGGRRTPGLPRPRELAINIPTRLDMLLDMPPASRELQVKYAWNAKDSSPNIIVKEDDVLTIYRNSTIQSTDCARGKTGFTRGIHAWEIHWPKKQRGSSAVVGVATQEAPLNADGYKGLVGSNDQSWGWDLGRNTVYHDNKYGVLGRKYPVLLKPEERFCVPDTFQVVLDMDEGTLAFLVDGKYLGLAFTDLTGRKLFPIVSTVWGHSNITMTYMGGLNSDPLSLQLSCRGVIRRCIGKERFDRVNELNVPPVTRNYIVCCTYARKETEKPLNSNVTKPTSSRKIQFRP